MKTLVDEWANAIAEQFVFRASNIIWEMAWIEVTTDSRHHVVMERGILNALWHITEYLYQDVYISKEHLSYILKQDPTLGNPARQTEADDDNDEPTLDEGASDKTIHNTLKKIIDTDERARKFSWFTESLAGDLMNKLGYTPEEKNAFKIPWNSKYITYRTDQAKNNIAAVRKTAISVHRIATAKPFTRWLVSELSNCTPKTFDDRASLVLNNYDSGKCRQRLADEIRGQLADHGYSPNPAENMRELKEKGTPPRNPRSPYQPYKKNASVYDFDPAIRRKAFSKKPTS